MAVNHNLLEMTSVPIQVEIHVTKASLENPEGTKLPKANVKRVKGGYHIETEPAKINIDTYGARSSLGYGHYKMSDFYKNESQRGIKLGYKGIAELVQDGNELGRGSTPVEIAQHNVRAGFTVQTMVDFLPKGGADLTYQKGAININYQVDDVDVDWENIMKSNLVFKPGSVEIVVKQHPKLQIRYVGEPIYFPPSANPNYTA